MYCKKHFAGKIWLNFFLKKNCTIYCCSKIKDAKSMIHTSVVEWVTQNVKFIWLLSSIMHLFQDDARNFIRLVSVSSQLTLYGYPELYMSVVDRRLIPKCVCSSTDAYVLDLIRLFHTCLLRTNVYDLFQQIHMALFVLLCFISDILIIK